MRLLVQGLSPLGLAACDGTGSMPLSVEIKNGAATAGGKPDEIELLVKTVPNAELHFSGQTKNTGDKATESFKIPKSTLKLGINTFSVEATTGVLFSKKAATAIGTYDAQPREILRFDPAPAAAGDGQLTCTSVMCSSTTFTIAGGHLPITVESAIAGVATVDGHKVTLVPGAKSPLDVDLSTKLAALQVGHDEVVTLPIVLEASGAKASDALELRGPALTDLAARQLAKIVQGPVAFAAERANAGDPDLLVVVGVPNRPMIVVGKPGKLEDVDLVAVAKPAERFFGCGSGGSGILYVDLDVTVFGRRTGKLVGTRKLLADRVPCPPTPTPGQLKGDVRDDDIKRVLAELLKK